ncbi:MAG TPA: reverse transcriptase-like protein [Candidatus Saccharimonadales bacterium]
MKQKVSVYALIKKGPKVLLLKRAQGNQAVIGKLELPGGSLPFDQSPLGAITNYIRSQLNIEPVTVQLYDVAGYISKYDPQLQRIDVLFLVALPEHTSFQLSLRHSRHNWLMMQELHQIDVTEATYNLLNLTIYAEEAKVYNEPKKLIVDKISTKDAIIYCDGGSRGNPGPSASGFVILDENEQLIEEGGAYLGITTNNQAEYHAVRLALEAASKHNIQQIQFRLDSMLVVNQIMGLYKIKSRDLWPIYERIKELTHHFKQVNFVHVRREFNKEADAMVNKILDEHTKLEK